MNKILDLNLEDIIRNTRYSSFSEMINNLVESINEAEVKAKLSSQDELQAGDIVAYVNQHGVGCTGTYYGVVGSESLCKDSNGDIHVAANVTKKVYRELSKQEAKNKICNILETQANPNTIQKVIDIIDRVK